MNPVLPPGFVLDPPPPPPAPEIPEGFVLEQQSSQIQDPLYRLPFPLAKIEAFVELQRRPPLRQAGAEFVPEPDRAGLEAEAAPVAEYLARQQAEQAQAQASARRAEVEDSGIGPAQQLVNRAGRGAVNDAVLSGLEGFAEMSAAGAGGEVRRANRQAAEQIQGAKQEVEKALPINPERMQGVEGFAGDVSQGVGQMVGNLATGGGIVSAQLTFGQMFQQGFEDAKANGATDEAAAQVGFLNLPAGAVEYLADRFALGKAKEAVSRPQVAGRLARKFAEGFASEAPTEAGQTAWQNLIANSLVGYDPERSTGEGVLYSGAVGGVVGGTVTGVPASARAGVDAVMDRFTQPAAPQTQDIAREFDNPDQAAALLSDPQAEVPAPPVRPAVGQSAEEAAGESAVDVDEDTRRVERFRARRREQFPDLSDEEIMVMARQDRAIERDMEAADAAARQRNDQRGADRMFAARLGESAQARQDEINRQAAVLRDELGEDALDVPVSQAELEALTARARAQRAASRQAAAEAARREKLATIEGMSLDELAEYTLDGDPDARSALLANLDGDEAAANQYLQEASERRAVDQELRAERESAEAEAEDVGNREDILTAVKALGGIPVTDDSLRGELKLLREQSRNAFSYFRKDAMPLDRLREALQERGFPGMNTPDDVIQALENALSGRRVLRADPQGAVGPNYARRSATVPERLFTLRTQLRWLREGKRQAVSVPYPAALEMLDTSGLAVFQTKAEGAFVYDPARLSEADIRAALDEGRLGDVLGYGVPAKPARPLGSVTIRDAQGREKQSVVVDRQGAPAALRAARAVADPGDRVTLEDSGEALRYRVGLTAPMRMAAGEQVRQAAKQWAENLRRIAPGLVDQVTLRVQSADEFRREMAALGYDPRTLTGDEQAAMDSHRAIIYLISEHLLANDSDTNLVNVQHELAHHFWHTLDAETQAEMARLHAYEVRTRTGPLYENGQLRPGMADGVEEVGTKYGLKEWFAERMARANHDWARAQIEGRDIQPQGIIERIASILRDILGRMMAALRGEWTRDDILREFRRFLLQGERWRARQDVDYARREERQSPSAALGNFWLWVAGQSGTQLYGDAVVYEDEPGAPGNTLEAWTGSQDLETQLQAVIGPSQAAGLTELRTGS